MPGFDRTLAAFRNYVPFPPTYSLTTSTTNTHLLTQPVFIRGGDAAVDQGRGGAATQAEVHLVGVIMVTR